MSGHKGQVVAYIRVSTLDQNEGRQVAAVGAVDRYFIDKASGKNTERPQLKAMLEYVRESDVVRVQSPDRLSRSTADLLGLIETFKAKGVDVEFTDSPALNTNSAQGEFFLVMAGALAQMERKVLLERQAQGIALAKARGVYDRAPKLNRAQIDDARMRIEELGVPLSRVARDLEVSRQTLYSALQGRGRYATG